MLNIIIVLFSFVFCFSIVADDHHWGYVGKNGVKEWGNMYKTCDTSTIAKKQSPINIIPSGKSGTSALSFNYNISDLSVIYNGHAIQVTPKKSNNTITYNSVEYTLKQFHVHTKSEHQVKGKAYPADIHLVHADKKNNLLVIGYFLEIDKKESHLLLSEAFSSAPTKEGESKLIAKADVKSLITTNLERYEYQGSLTTPPCSEGVQWIVMKQPLKINKESIDNIIKIVGNNSRPVQDLNSREVIEVK